MNSIFFESTTSPFVSSFFKNCGWVDQDRYDIIEKPEYKIKRLEQETCSLKEQINYLSKIITERKKSLEEKEKELNEIKKEK
jgi:predicted RNase H-like nuclease (RuvC/YqgF family)